MGVLVGFLLVWSILFSLRRLVWVAASWLPPHSTAAADGAPSVLLAVAFRNEERQLPDLLGALAALDYPRDRLHICLIDDASTDSGNSLARGWVSANAHAQLLTMPANVGKAEALNRALHATKSSEVIAVFDADVRPRRDCLRQLTAPFADRNVVGVTGYLQPAMTPGSFVSAYAALEAWSHQLVNLAAKDRLGMNPPATGGNCAYRRAALVDAGGFPAGAFSEDTAVSLALANRGGVLRFVRAAICDHRATSSLRFFLNQRQRWSYGMAAVMGQARGIESVFVSLGYADRVATLAVASLVASGWLSPWWLALIGVPVAAAIGSAVAKGRPRASEWWLLAVGFPLMAAVDVGVSLVAMARNLIQQGPKWASRTKEVLNQNA